MLLLLPQSSMAPVCLTFKIPAKFLAEIRNGLFIKSISLHSVGGLGKKKYQLCDRIPREYIPT